MSGIFISLEGPDGSGKTTLLKNILPFLKSGKRHVTTTREPGGVRIAEDIREIILNPGNDTIDEKTELLLFVSARRQHLNEKVLPALKKGDIVIVDRFTDSSSAYQGYGRGLGIESVNWLNDFATDGLKPQLTMLLDIDSETGLLRVMSGEDREVNRLDLEAIEMHRKVREGYLEIAQNDPERFVVIDATLPPEEVSKLACAVILERFPQIFL